MRSYDERLAAFAAAKAALEAVVTDWLNDLTFEQVRELFVKRLVPCGLIQTKAFTDWVMAHTAELRKLAGGPLPNPPVLTKHMRRHAETLLSGES